MMVTWENDGNNHNLLISAHYQAVLHFDALKIIAVENIVRKGEIACSSNFSFSHNVFFTLRGTNFSF